MNKFKFAVDKKGFYSHYGTDGTIDFDKNFNKDNEPLNCRYIDGEWVVDIEKLKQESFDILCVECDRLNAKLAHNNTYKYDLAEFEKKEQEILEKLKTNRAILNNLAGYTVKQLKQIIED